MKRLIVNADDFGFTHEVNEGIVEAHRNGILTATTLMANGDAFRHAVELARENPTLDVGVHLVMVQGYSVLHPDRALPSTIGELLSQAMRGKLPIYDELRAQVRKIVAAGIQPSHIDTHKHTQLYPPIFLALARVAREFNIPWVRGVAFEKRLFRPALRGLKTTDHFVGFRLTGSLSTATLVGALEKLPEGLTEFMCHPGRVGPELMAAATRLKESREIELAALTSAELPPVLKRGGIRLVNYRNPV